MSVRRKPATLHYVNFDHALCRRLMNRYGIEEEIVFRPILLDGDVCSLIDVRSETSRKMVLDAGRRRLFLKQIPWYCSREQAAFALAAQESARVAGVAVPKSPRTVDGAPFVVFDDAMFSLSEYVRGRRYEDRQDQDEAAARELARLHAVRPPADVAAPSADAFADAEEHLDLAADLARERADTAAGAALRGLRDWLSVSEVQARAAGWSDLEAGLVHGDWSPWNLVYAEAPPIRVVAAVDFDNAHLGPRVRDVAEMVLTFAAVDYAEDSTTFAASLPTSVRRGVERLLGCYDHAAPLTAVERRCLPTAAAAVAVEILGLGYVRGDFSAAVLASATGWADRVVDRVASAVAALAPAPTRGARASVVGCGGPVSPASFQSVRTVTPLKSTPPLPPALLVWSGKGGVGKSTIAAHLALGLRDAGRRVGFLDADVHGPSAPTLFGTGERLGVCEDRIRPVAAGRIPVVSSGLLAGPAQPMVSQGMLLEGGVDQPTHGSDWGDCDLLVVDMPPGTGEVQTALLSCLDTVGTVVVTTPHDVAFDDVLRSAHLLRRAGVPVTALVTNLATVTCPSCSHEFTPFPGSATERLAALFPHAETITVPLETGNGGDVLSAPLPGMSERLRPIVVQFARVDDPA